MSHFLNYIILCIFCLIQSLNSIGSNHFCIVSEKQCTGSYDVKNNYRINCTNLCHGEYQVPCGKDMCATTSVVCDEHINITQIFKSLFKALKYNLEKKKFETFNKHIKRCPVMAHRWQPSDVCMTGLNCMQLIKFPMRIGNINVPRRVKCKCPSEYSFMCDDQFCASHMKACSAFLEKEINDRNEALNYGIKECGNDNKIFR